MLFQELYDAAVQLVAEDPSHDTSEDYEERASYILATFCSQCAEADRLYRLANGLGNQSTQAVTYVPLSNTFPLSDRFAPAATYYLSAMLTVDENEELSEKFFALYADALASIRASLPATAEKIGDRYGLL